MFGRSVFGWLPWAPGVSKKNFLFGNLLAISCSFNIHTQKSKLNNFFQKKLFLKNITLKKGENFNENLIKRKTKLK